MKSDAVGPRVPFYIPNFDEKEFYATLKDEDFWDEPDLSQEIEKQIQYNIQCKKPEFEDYKKYILIVDNIPTISSSKLPDLKSRINLILAQAGVVPVNIEYPFDEDKSKGFFFIFLESENECLKLKRYMNNYRFSPTYILKCYTLADREALLSNSEGQNPVTSYEFEDLANVDDHIKNYQDTLAVVDSRGTANIYSVDPIGLKFKIPNFTGSKVQWSPKGTYLVGFNENGIVLSSGFSKATMEFRHFGANSCDFSPCERFMVTCGYSESENIHKMSINVWDTSYNKSSIKILTSNNKLHTFRWSYDGCNLSFLSEESLFVYDMTTNVMVGGRPFKIPGVQTYEWSTMRRHLVYWEKGENDTHSQIVLLEIPSFEKRLLYQAFNLEKCSMIWNQTGTSIAVACLRYIKKKTNHSLGIIRIDQDGTPFESIECKTAIEDISWEPYGTFFTLVAPPDVKILKRINDSSHLSIKAIGNSEYHKSLWSPYGKLLILASTKNHVYFEVHHCEGKTVTLLGRGQHLDANYIAWSASGSYFITAAVGGCLSSSKVQIWSCCGYFIENILILNIAYSIWRPRSTDFISADDIGSIWKNLDKYAKELVCENRNFNKLKNENDSLVNIKMLFPHFNDSLHSNLKKLSDMYFKNSEGNHNLSIDNQQPLYQPLIRKEVNFKSKV